MPERRIFRRFVLYVLLITEGFWVQPVFIRNFKRNDFNFHNSPFRDYQGSITDYWTHRKTRIIRAFNRPVVENAIRKWRMAERVGTTLDKETARKHVNIFDFLGDLGFEERVG